ncbi:hypothetical protein SMGD1_2439 [Sulfurimonas gotlandica GD1]|uniref:Uncharacterized protein n=1 Tax=Sulfurimonas gotlandica (strain DSM 19862 / JCM 16533 / GD1) TaxID=929558 RepID=B6BN92_SULGG|nr:hypothetical protein [Sulfurimonas gotlandica]EDZ61379.1 conserved hypothetical protein [Sulfurimonas gotlandica GD1]EHP30962.1 hypothetical protein SMGD1_2439 [Sulfurimonas gotlandica GD1]
MSIKNNIEMVREELNSEEKFFEKAVITEKFIKKYKNLMIGAVVVLVVLVGANVAYSINKQSQITAANVALLTLSEDATNSEALLTLKSISPELYDVWVYSNAVAKKDMITMKELTNSSAIMVGDLAKYELAQDTKNAASLDAYASKQDAVYRDLALVQSAIILMSNSQIQKAHEKLSQISPQSSLNKIANALLHYGVK